MEIRESYIQIALKKSPRSTEIHANVPGRIEYERTRGLRASRIPRSADHVDGASWRPCISACVEGNVAKFDHG